MSRHEHRSRWTQILFFFLALGSIHLQTTQMAYADIANFDLAAKIYSKWLFRNNDKHGILWLGHPAEKDNYSGDNGVGAEVDLILTGNISKFVKAQVRIKSRFGALWHNWWENGDLRDIPDVSGESLGMNHAEYIKLRGYWFRIRVPAPFINYIHVGSSDLSQFNEWTIGKVRFIDRDNGKGIFVDGGLGDSFKYHIGIIPLPKMWVGPGWNTGIGDTALAQPFIGQDYAYALKIDAKPLEWWSFRLIGSVVLDWEANRFDPDAIGSANPTGAKDGAVALSNRFFHLSTTFETSIEAGDNLTLHFLFGYTDNRINELYATNRIPEGGFYNLAWGDRRGMAIRARANLDDPFEAGLSFKAEGFYISPEYNAAFGARREADVLLTHGFLGGGQLPTLNIANEFMDFDEPWFESMIGWAGGTLLTTLGVGSFSAKLEGTFLTYTTNNPTNPTTGELLPRDVDTIYPSFPGLHTGVTDTDFFNNNNRQDFGRDPRNVYRRYQDRMSIIARLAMRYTINVGKGITLFGDVKFIYDVDGRQKQRTDDDYEGQLLFAGGGFSMPVADWLAIEAGFRFSRWQEKRVFGNDEQGYSSFVTYKYKPYLKLRINFGGVKIAYQIEYIHRDLLRDRQLEEGNRVLDDRFWRVVRSKATAEVAW